MPAKSESQRKLFGAALAYKRGENPDASGEVREIANSMSEDKLEEFAKSTKSDNTLKDKNAGYTMKNQTSDSFNFVDYVLKFKEAKKGAAWTRREGQNSEGGLNEKGRKSYESQNPGSDLKAPVTGKVKKGGKASKRRKSFCARSDGQRKMHNIDCSKTPEKRICKARRKWKCASDSSFSAGFSEGYSI